MSNLYTMVRDTVIKYNMLQKNDSVVIGLSGGADSVALVYTLLNLKSEFNLSLTAVHINHQIRDEAYLDQQFVTELCRRLNIPLEVYCFDIKKISLENKQSEEETGREKRYEAFTETAQRITADKIAVAHNINDNSETVIFNLCRGTGIKGLCGIPPVRHNIIRPLIKTGRDEIESFLYENKIEYRHDKSNSFAKYTRNKIRLKLLPVIKAEIKENVDEVVFRTSELLRQENDFLDSVATEAYINCLSKRESKKIFLRADKLTEHHDVIKRRIFRLALSELNFLRDITYKQLDTLLSLPGKPTGKVIELNNQIEAAKEYDSIVIRKKSNFTPYRYIIEHEKLQYIKEIDKYILATDKNIGKLTNLHLLCTRIFDYDKIVNRLELRTRMSGDLIYVEKMGGRKKIKDYFIDNKTPREKRNTEPLLADGQTIMWIVNTGVMNSLYELKDSDTKKKLYVNFYTDT